MSSLETISTIITHWKQKWDIEENDFDKFICYWISLNAWYWKNIKPIPSNGRYITDRDYMNWIKKILLDKEINWNEEINSAKAIKPKLKNKTREPNPEITVVDLDSLFEFVYTIRNNLFHGNKMDTNERDNEILNVSTPILKKILSSLIW